MFDSCKNLFGYSPSSSDVVVVDLLPAPSTRHKSISRFPLPLEKEHRSAAGHTIEQLEKKHAQLEQKHNRLQAQYDGQTKALRAIIIDLASTKEHLSATGLLDILALRDITDRYTAEVRQCGVSGDP